MKTRWLINGQFTTASPLHIGCGTPTSHPLIINEKSNEQCEIAAVVRRHPAHGNTPGEPCIPGTALKGVLRSWAERHYPHEQRLIETIFGSKNCDDANANAGLAEFYTAPARKPYQAKLSQFEKYLPYWQPGHLTGIASHVCLNRETGAAEAERLFYEEFVPVGVDFDLRITATGLEDEAIAFLLTILEEGAAHNTHPYQFGANSRDGWGRMKWTLSADAGVKKSPDTLEQINMVPGAAVGYGFCTIPWRSANDFEFQQAEPPANLQIEITLQFDGPLLVNDASRDKQNYPEGEQDGRTNLTALRREDGHVWLPASSLRGAIRQRAEFLLRSLNPTATGDPTGPIGIGPIERLFGHTTQAARLLIEEPQSDPSDSVRQDLVAIDRFTGGAADGAKFDAIYAANPTLHTRLRLDLQKGSVNLERGDIALLLACLQDICKRQVTFGHGAGKGYGHAHGTVKVTPKFTGDNPWGFPADIWDLKDTATDWSAWFDQAMKQYATGTATVTTTGGENQTPSNAAPAQANPAPTQPATLLIPGKLIRENTRAGERLFLEAKNKKGEVTRYLITSQNQLSADLRADRAIAIEVDFERDRSGLPHQVRHKGQPWQMVAAQAPGEDTGGFIHPYYFLSMKDRSKFQGELADLGEKRPTGHLRYQPGFYSGTRRVRLTTKTPLILCDTTNDDRQPGHKTYATRVDAQGKPLIESSSVRGMLRAAFEAVTNSRFGVFPGKPATEGKPATGHGRRLGYRTSARSGTDAIPVRIESRDGQLLARILAGKSTLGNNGLPFRDQALCAAWCASYHAWKPINRDRFKHKDHVWAYLTPWSYSRGNISFRFWNVEELQPYRNEKPTGIPPATGYRKKMRNASPDPWGNPGWYAGYLNVSNRNMTGKHDERFFFHDPDSSEKRAGAGPDIFAEVGPEIREQWRQLIQDYHDQHRDTQDLQGKKLKRDRTLPTALPEYCVFSRHITHDLRTVATDEQELSDGTLAYARVYQEKGTWKILSLFPVMIRRQLHPKSPLDLLPDSLRPARKMSELSPADRVFGWVSQDAEKDDKQPAYRGHVQIGPVTCKSDDAVIKPFDHGLGATLAILAQPKPQQGRFYLGTKTDGLAQQNKLDKGAAGYHDNNRVRGPKIYPHHIGFELQSRSWQSDEQNDQNRTITDWVRPEVDFEFDLRFENLTEFELGALIWLLSMEDDHYLRLGLGKPLGFGSVRATIQEEGTEIADGVVWTSRIGNWQKEPLPRLPLSGFVESFKTAINKANPNLLKTYLRAAKGFEDRPIHYPRLQGQPAHEHYHWFVSNDNNRALALPDLSTNDPGLPYQP